MQIKFLILFISIIFISGCISVPKTGALLSQATNNSIFLTEALEDDGLLDLADKTTEYEEILSQECENVSSIAIEHLESDVNPLRTFFKYIFGEINLSECQRSARSMKKFIDEIIIKYPKYSKFRILIPKLPSYDIGVNNKK